MAQAHEKLLPRLEVLAQEQTLVQAWKKASNYIRSHNWFSDTLELDLISINLPSFISSLSEDILSGKPYKNDPLKLVPAPKSQEWELHSNNMWRPVSDEEKIRPLAHCSIRDQVLTTAIMMCLADRVETSQGNPAAKVNVDKENRVTSYGNRLLCDVKNNQLRHRWGSKKLFRGYFEDYKAFLERPELIAEHLKAKGMRPIFLHSDLDKFYDRVTPEFLNESVLKFKESEFENSFFRLVGEVMNWTWSESDEKEISKYAKDEGIESFARVALPQGLVASGFFANIALSSLDNKLKQTIDTEPFEGIKIYDAIRYVDDFRIVAVIPSHTPIELAKVHLVNWLKSEIEETVPDLKISEAKTKCLAYISDDRPRLNQSQRMNRIQSAISGGFDASAGGEILDSLVGLVRAQERVDSYLDREDISALVPTTSVKDDTINRFSAGRFRSTFRSLRPLLWENVDVKDDNKSSYFDGIKTQEEIDESANSLAHEWVFKWVTDPSNVRLLRIALDLYPSAKLLNIVLSILTPFVSEDNKGDYSAKVAWYCLSEIFKAGALETGQVLDPEHLPNGLDIVAYRETLSAVAKDVIKEGKSNRLPWYLLQQAYLFLIASGNYDTIAYLHDRKEETKNYRELLAYFRDDAFRDSNKLDAEFAVISRRSFTDSKTAIKQISKRMDGKLLNSLAHLDPNFAYEVISSTPSFLDYLNVQNRSDLSIIGDSYSESSNTLSDLVFTEETKESLRNEYSLLTFAKKFLENLNEQPKINTITPSNVLITLKGKRSRAQRVSKLEIEQAAYENHDSLYSPPKWAKESEVWRFQLGYLLRFILTAQPDFTASKSNALTLQKSKIYRKPASHWLERMYGHYGGHKAYGDDWLPITDWTERFLFALLRWPGCKISNQEIKKFKTIEQTLFQIKKRIRRLKRLQKTSVDIMPIKMKRNSDANKNEPIRACVIQTVFPSAKDFPKAGSQFTIDDFTLSKPPVRKQHRQHLSAALATVEQALRLRETHHNQKGLDWLILPELAVHPEDVHTHLIPFARKFRTTILAGLTFEKIDKGPLVNSAVWVLPKKDKQFGLQIDVRRQGKANLIPLERDPKINGVRVVRPFRPCQWLVGYQWSKDTNEAPLWMSASVCFDATDIQLAADLKDESDVFVVPALNKDTGTFDNMAQALHYHMFQFVIVANNGTYGGSSAYAPYKDPWKRKVFHMHGQPQASIAFMEIENISEFKNRKMKNNEEFKSPPAGNI